MPVLGDCVQLAGSLSSSWQRLTFGLYYALQHFYDVFLSLFCARELIKFYMIVRLNLNYIAPLVNCHFEMLLLVCKSSTVRSIYNRRTNLDLYENLPQRRRPYWFLLFLLSFLLRISAVRSWQESVKLMGDASEEQVRLSWTSDVSKEVIMLQLVVKTKGWVGLGLSQTASMAGADIVIGWIDDKGRKHFQDCWSERNGRPTVDESQDWTLHTARRNGSYTMIRVRRKLNTHDHHDLPITGDPIYVLYAWGSADPPRVSDIVYHGAVKRGSSKLCLLHPECDVIPTAAAQRMTSSNLVVIAVALFITKLHS